MLRIEALKGIETEKIYKNSNDNVTPSHPFRCILSGLSGSGKSNLLMTMLMKPGTYYDFLNIFSSYHPILIRTSHTSTCSKMS